jgi:hypothetical protein
LPTLPKMPMLLHNSYKKTGWNNIDKTTSASVG